VAVANQLALLFIPKTKVKDLNLENSVTSLTLLKQRLGFMAFLQMIVGNRRAEMMM
jgi:hypothetical protein